MDFHTAVFPEMRQGTGFRFHQIQNGILYMRENCFRLPGLCSGNEAVVFPPERFQLRQHQIERGTVLFSPGSEQAVAGFVIKILLAVGQPRQPSAVDDLEPVFPARIDDIQFNIHPLAQSAKHFDILRRDGRFTKKVHPLRQAGRRLFAVLIQYREKTCDRIALERSGFFRDFPPQGSLPGLIVPCRRLSRMVMPDNIGHFPASPDFQPFRSVKHISLEKRRHPAGEIETHDVVTACEIRRQSRICLCKTGFLEKPQDPPGQDRGRKRRRLSDHDQRSDLLPEPLRQKRECHIGAHTIHIGNGQHQFPFHGGAGHNHLIRRENGSRTLCQIFAKHLQQDFKTVGLVQVQHAEKKTEKDS